MICTPPDNGRGFSSVYIDWPEYFRVHTNRINQLLLLFAVSFVFLIICVVQWRLAIDTNCHRRCDWRDGMTGTRPSTRSRGAATIHESGQFSALQILRTVRYFFRVRADWSPVAPVPCYR